MQCSLTVTSLVAALAFAGCGAANSTLTVRPGRGQIRAGGPRVAGAGDKFAGLVWTGAVHSVAARWRVPTIRAGSQPGRGATWIGAQGFAVNGTQPFIQIGTREELQTAGPGRKAGKLVFEAFWTDVVRGLHPISLFAVRPGDDIGALMTLAGQRWSLTITDRTSRLHRRLSTPEEGTGRFRLALWLQEDATRTADNRVFAYPDLSSVHLSALAVNGGAPAVTALKSTWMALPHAYLGPTQATGDAFAVIPKMLSPVGAAYLSIAGAMNAQLNRYEIEATGWRAKTPQSVIRAATDALISTMAETAARLSAQRWPEDVVTAVGRLERSYANQSSRLRQAVSAGPAAVLAAFSSGAGDGASGKLTDIIRRRLGVRQISY